MFSVSKPQLDPSALEMFRNPSRTTDFAHQFGRSALGSEYIEMEASYYRPTFYETELSRGTVLVDMDAHGDIAVPKGGEKRIATFGLGGCNAVAISGELPDGTRRGYIQHYSPLNQRLGAHMLAEAANVFAAEGAKNVRTVIMTPGEPTYDPSSVKWSMEPKDDLLVGLLTGTVQRTFGTEADIQVYSYSEMRSEDQYGQGTLMIEFGADGTVNMLAEAMPVMPRNEQ